MTKKNQNSLLLLTTLGVYIGLLMAGGTPGVAAQQGAMTRNFEISDEIEVRDDLDTIPDPSGEAAALEPDEALFVGSAVSAFLKLHFTPVTVEAVRPQQPAVRGSVLVRRPRYLETYPTIDRHAGISADALPRSGLAPLHV